MKGEPMFSVGQQYAVIELTTASRLFFSGRCLLYNVTLAGDGANADCQVFDARQGTGKEVIHLEALSGTAFSWRCNTGAIMENGIYVTVNASTAHVSISYIPLEKKSFRGH